MCSSIVETCLYSRDKVSDKLRDFIAKRFMHVLMLILYHEVANPVFL